MKIIHICDGWEEWNGAAGIARLIGNEQKEEGERGIRPGDQVRGEVGEKSGSGRVEVKFLRWASWRELKEADEVWIHCGWKPCLWWAALVAGRKAKWVPEACYDPVRLSFSAWKKRLAGPIERFCLRRCKAIVATCEAEKGWLEEYLGMKAQKEGEVGVGREEKGSGQGIRPRGEGEMGDKSGTVEIEIIDVKRFFDLGTMTGDGATAPLGRALRVLYLGRQHPLKGVEFLEQAVKEMGREGSGQGIRPRGEDRSGIELHIVSNKFGAEKEKEWEWCDVLCLPTLSDNLGLVVAEALERGKFVITTDGAPAWRDYFAANPSRGIYIEGYRDGTKEERVALLRNALEKIVK